MVKRLLIFLLVIAPLVTTNCTSDDQELQWHQEGNYRWAAVESGYFDDGGFQMMDSSVTNINFSTHVTQKEINDNQIVLNGTGVATADIDGDGWTDIYFTQLNGPNKLYKNIGGFLFRDITEEAGVAHKGNYSTGTLFADVDGDRDQDLLVSTIDGQNAVYINDGQGHFRLKKDSGLQNGNGSTTMTMADIDSDGDLDLFVANNKKRPVYDIFSEEELEPKNLVKRPEGKQIPGKTRYEFKEPFGKYYRFIYRKNQRAMMEEVGEYNHLYINDGTGQFSDVTNQDGRFQDQKGKPADLKPEWSLTARFQDINGDHLPDLYICNDYFNPDRVWINQGNGQFKEIDRYAFRSFSYSAMGIGVSDIDRDGHYDLFVTEMLSSSYNRKASQYTSMDMRPGMIAEPGYQPQYMHNSMYLNRGDDTFREIAYYSGLEASEWSWATRFLDMDLDGYEDLVINTGYPYDAIDMDYSYNSSRYKGAVDLGEAPRLDMQNKIFRNNGDLTFSQKSEEWGFTEPDVSYGLATADFDLDGDLDIVTSRFGSNAVIYKNNVSAPRIAVRLVGQSPNTQAVGAEVILRGGPVRQSKQVLSGGDYLSGSDTQLMFAATPGNKHTLHITWSNGTSSIVDSVQANRIYEVSQPQKGGSTLSAGTHHASADPIFKDVSNLVNHQHKAATFDDFQRQPLMPYKISSEGPGIAWIDVDHDNDEDLVIGGGNREAFTVYENRGDMDFAEAQRFEDTSWGNGSATSILGWEESGKVNIMAGISNYRQPGKDVSVPSAQHYHVGNGELVIENEIQGVKSSVGPLAAADYDMDGDLDLFIGGRVLPGQYPRSSGTRLFKNEQRGFEQDQSNTAVLANVGMVTGAVFSDYDRDGDPDLVLTTEWGSLKIFENKQATFVEQTEKMGLASYKGQWKSIATGDFNNDGLIDIVATNIGGNTPYRVESEHPLKMYFSDLDMDGTEEIIEAGYDHQMEGYVPMRKLYDFSVFSAVLSSRVSSFEQYSNRTLNGLFGRSVNQLPSKEINTLEHMVFLNAGEEFEAHPLPPEAQFSTALGTSVADFNNDGNEDLYLSQNFLDFYESFPRQDAGRGLWLKGNGTGNFEVVSGMKSGIKIYGAQRGVALGDFNADGRVDMAVTQQDSTTKLYQNTTDKKGIRIRLQGPKRNGWAIGSSARLQYSDGSCGPVREIQAGSGHWSMNGVVNVLGTKESAEPTEILIRWFDGAEKSVAIEPGKRSYTIVY